MRRLPAILGSVLAFMVSGTAQKAEAQVVRIAELEIDPAQLDRYEPLLREEIAVSIRREPGVLALNAVALKTAPNHIRILEIYADPTAYEAHLKTPHFLKYKAATAAMVTRLTLLETDPVMLCTKADARCLSR